MTAAAPLPPASASSPPAARRGALAASQDRARARKSSPMTSPLASQLPGSRDLRPGRKTEISYTFLPGSERSMVPDPMSIAGGQPGPKGFLNADAGNRHAAA